MNIQAGIEYNKLATTLHSIYTLLLQIESELAGTNYNSEVIRADLFVLSYSAKKHVASRLREYNWVLEGGIIVPAISSGIIKLQDAVTQTIEKLMVIADECSLLNEVENILNGGELYIELEERLSYDIKNQFA